MNVILVILVQDQHTDMINFLVISIIIFWAEPPPVIVKKVFLLYIIYMHIIVHSNIGPIVTLYY